MNFELLWSNLSNYCLQIGLLIGIAAFIPTALRLSMPRVRLAFWHLLLAACILVPLAAPKRQQVVSGDIQVTTHAAVPLVAARPALRRTISWDQAGLILLAGGAGVRLIWLCVGLWRLRQYRRRSHPLVPAPSWSVEADVRIAEDVSSPVTFGCVHPVVLLPANFPDLDAAAQEAVLCHEVLHVRRKDWLLMIAEELVRSVFWFHPAIWWLLGEIGLAREQAVDQEVVEMTRSREEYVDALLAIAGAKPSLDLAPAPLFLRKRHLKQRVVSIMKEVRMSKKRSISALAAGLGILAAACWFTTLTFPLAAEPQVVNDGPGVTVDVGSSGLMHRTGIYYPDVARRARIEGTVIVEAVLDSGGNVVDARILSGPNELRRSVLQSVLQWHFANDNGATTRQVRITFQTPAEPTPRTVPRTDTEMQRQGVIGGVPGGVLGGVISSVPTNGPPPPPPPGFAGKTLKQITVAGISEDAKSRLLSRLPVKDGDILSSDSYLRTILAVHEYDEHLMVSMRQDREGGVNVVITAPGANVPMEPVARAVVPPPDGVKRIHIGGNVQASKLINQPKPVYPPLAKQARISGTVSLMAIINRDGTMKDLQVISGHPLLIPAALEAVKQWVYQPTLLNGEPVEVQTQVDVNFTLSDGPPPQE